MTNFNAPDLIQCSRRLDHLSQYKKRHNTADNSDNRGGEVQPENDHRMILRATPSHLDYEPPYDPTNDQSNGQHESAPTMDCRHWPRPRPLECPLSPLWLSAAPRSRQRRFTRLLATRHVHQGATSASPAFVRPRKADSQPTTPFSIAGVAGQLQPVGPPHHRSVNRFGLASIRRNRLETSAPKSDSISAHAVAARGRNASVSLPFESTHTRISYLGEST